MTKGRGQSPLALLTTRPAFARLFSAQMISVLGDRFSQVALSTMALHLSDGAAVPVAVILATSLGPPALFGWVAGPLVDRVHRVRLMVLFDLVRAVAILGAVFAGSVFTLYAISLIIGIAQTFFRPAFQSLLPDTLDAGDLFPANSLSASTESAVNIGGMALGAAVIGLFGLSAAFVIDSATFLISALLIGLLAARGYGSPPRRPALTGMRAYWQDIGEGIQYHHRSPVVLSLLILMSTASLGLGGFNALIPLIPTRIHGLPEQTWGYIAAAMAAGMTLGNLAVAHWGQQLNRVLLIAAGFLVAAATAWLALLTPVFGLSLVFFFLSGAANAGFFPPQVAWLQEIVPPHFRGRVFSFRYIAIHGAMVPSGLVAGFLADRVNLIPIWMALGGIVALCGLLTPLMPALRRAAAERETAGA